MSHAFDDLASRDLLNLAHPVSAALKLPHRHREDLLPSRTAPRIDGWQREWRANKAASFNCS
ncbi:hypothetical protein CIC12_07035 [Burkholderia sp. SG-MS1]|nr:hypothetical protein [Paraburkholderia sp. SG-MS1]